MKRFVSKEFETDCRICGEFNSAPLSIARAITSKTLQTEKTHLHNHATEFYIFLKGRGKFLVNDEILEYSVGDVFMIEPNEPHKMLEIEEETDYITIRTNNFSDKIIVK